MGYTLTKQQLQKEAWKLETRHRIVLGALSQNISDARKAKFMKDLEILRPRLDECRDQLLLIDTVLKPIYEQGQDTTKSQLQEASNQGDMGALMKQRPDTNVREKQDAEHPVARELQINPELAKRIEKLLKSGDDEKIEKGLKQGEKAPGKKDAKTDKMSKEFKEKIKKFKKLKEQMVTSLKKLQRSDSEEVKRCLQSIKKGKVDVGMRGLKGVSRTGGFQNETANAAKDLMGSIEGMYKLVGLDTNMIFRREFDKTANQPNWMATVGKSDSDMRMDSATERADNLDKVIADIATGKADNQQKKIAITAGALKAGSSR